MKAAVVTAAGAVPQCQDFPEPEAGPGLQLVELVASAIHPVVRSKADGVHYSSTGQYPMIPGVDAVARTADGALVYTGETQLPWGTFAERMAVPMAAPLPERADPLAVAAGMNPGMASWMPLTTHVDERGVPDTVMVLGPTGAAGGLAVQNARALGARRIIGVGRGAADLARVAGYGAETVELTGERDADARAIAAALDGATPDLVLDYLWGTPAESAFQALHGLEGANPTNYVEIGSIAGADAAVPAALLRSRPFRLSGSGIGSFDMHRYLVQAQAYLKVIADGKIAVDTAPYPLSQCAAAWTAKGGPRAVLTAE
ncbi:zinc-binding alcohol dehydrogenase family protein [Streptomyces sp. NPDC005562]|uniref:zinc-binding alcohol dehydrogenase family protein n=1 Tax=Streptomyces sp. NPDC005562 TaxID=3154890 RepID=UPI0033B8C331